MNWARHAAGLSDRPDRFPTKATCLCDLFARRQRAAAARRDAGQAFPLGRHARGGAARRCLLPMSRPSSGRSVLDYDDLLLYFAQMLGEPEIAAEIAGRFDHLLVDEYQDTNRLQAEIALKLRPRGRGLTVVGDDAQSIYSFRAATVRNILDFPSSFDPPARVVTLDRNYRSTQPILAASNAVIAPRRPSATPRTSGPIAAGGATPALVTVGEEADQARFVATRVLENREAGQTLKSQAVLFRAAHHSRRARTRTDAAQRAVRQIRRAEVSRRRAYQGCARAAAFRREPARPDRRLSRRAAAAGHRPGERGEDGRGGGRGRRLRDAERLISRPPRRARRSPSLSAASPASPPARPGRRTSAKSWRGGARISTSATTMSLRAPPTSTRWSASR